ncbi:MAG: HAD-IA family hydrolase [Gloeocapsa sp. UFS-A4-WI-NPMV-4B04]|jgi:putative hydrolase of the HAD superfamily|nr:HAD-IA family hydrolase [Gloeocapsa sp. UFS-A4-WI-NPMV-4B04]
MQRPKVIFLDAVNTLFGVKGSVGEVYAGMAKQFGVEVSAVALEREFIKSFQAAPPPMFPGIELQNIQKSEFNWWHSVSLHTFAQVGVLHQFSDFSAFFTQLYTYFATAEPWFVYPDVYPVLKRWQQLEVELGVLSNFDSRLYSVLEALDLSQFFTSITISTEVGAAKPDPKIFEVALKKHNSSAQLALHIGDSWQEDYQGANAAGLKAIWLQRKKQA